MLTRYGPKVYNIDINQLGTSQYPRFSIFQDAQFKDAIIEDIILDNNHPQYTRDGSNVGFAKIRFIPDDRGVSTEELNWAAPLDTSIREYPLKNEMVLVFYSLNRLFYTRRVNSTNKLGESSWLGLSKNFSPPLESDELSTSAVIASQGGIPYRPSEIKNNYSLGDDFVENPSVRMVQPKEGDLIIQGRFGNIIRMGSSLFTNPTTTTLSPNMLFTVGQGLAVSTSTTTKGNPRSPYELVYEDLDIDASSIWMLSDELVEKFTPATLNSSNANRAHLRNSDIERSAQYFSGAQIFLNSDRLILNSKKNEIQLFSKTEINLSALNSITVASENNIHISSNIDVNIDAGDDIVITGKNVSIVADKNLSQTVTGDYIILGKKIFIGNGVEGSQPLVLGGELASFLGDMLDKLYVNISTTFLPNPANPVGLPTFLASIEQLKLQLGITRFGISNPSAAIFNSKDNFTTRINKV